MQSLKKNIDEYKAAMAGKVPVEVGEVMAQCTADLLSTGVGKHALKAGDVMPDFELPNQRGEMKLLYDYLAVSPVVLNIYRGGWCPYCNMEMKALHEALPQIEASGARLVGMAPETPDKAATTAEQNELGIDILSDSGNRVAEKLGLVFDLPEALRPIYQKFGIDIPAYNGDSSFRLPVPATYIIGKDGKILFDFVNADYTQRLEPSEIIEKLADI
jgi:peroxiredoxin